MGIFIDPNSRVPYVLEDERPLPALSGFGVSDGAVSSADEARRLEENARRDKIRTTYTLRPLSVGAHSRRTDQAVLPNSAKTAVGTFVYLTLRYGLVGWSGGGAPAFVADADGYPTDETLSRLPASVRNELTRAINDISEPSVDDVKV